MAVFLNEETCKFNVIHTEYLNSLNEKVFPRASEKMKLKIPAE